ncbi:MAG: tRNA (N(6)-L-threonylcarbamoyladenosine(37)-C(2))-methylthiotransferase MtaB [candidate division KSB1 bacterium]|nr:tRNA (N(6)-L-threonylcarbamoyladenosine(37)-C(2))-methylthiotransferase MtaB [candidate division KSB1 bacterium]
MQERLRASFYTLGCRLNQAETGLISNSFRERGYEIVDFGEPADVCIINSCTVTEQADSKCRQIVRQVLRKNPDTFVAVVGCYAQTGFEAMQQIEGIDLIVGNQDKMQVIDLIDEPAKRPEPRIVRSRMTRAPFTLPFYGTDLPTTRANLKIQDGCDFMCSFCIIPFARGRARSRAFWDIQREAIELVETGIKEIVLTGVNIGTYQFEDKTFMDVVRMLLSIPGLRRLRISSIEPTTVNEELLDLMADSDVLCSHLHLPVQSGSDRILKSMRRVYSIREFLDFVERAHQRVPDVLIGTDIMVGFPGETDADFAESCRMLTDTPIAYAHVFTYSERPGTASTKIAEKIDPRIKKQRSKAIHRLSEQCKLAFYQQFIGRTVRVLTEEQDFEGRWLGFADNYIRVAIAEPDLQENQLVLCEIQSVDDKGIAIGKLIGRNGNEISNS